MTKTWDRELVAATGLALQAGFEAKRLSEATLDVNYKAKDDPVTNADKAAHDIICSGLHTNFPDDVVVSEESEPPAGWEMADRVWVVDPLDGTKDYIKGLVGWSAMIGLLVKQQPVVGVVYCPAANRLLTADAGHATWTTLHEGQPGRWAVAKVSDRTKSLRLISSRAHRDTEASCKVKQHLDVTDEVEAGSIGFKFGLIVTNQGDFYVATHGHCKIWDVCGPTAILAAAGGRVTDKYGDPLDWTNQHMAKGVVATNGSCHNLVVAALQR